MPPCVVFGSNVVVVDAGIQIKIIHTMMCTRERASLHDYIYNRKYSQMRSHVELRKSSLPRQVSS